MPPYRITSLIPCGVVQNSRHGQPARNGSIALGDPATQGRPTFPLAQHHRDGPVLPLHRKHLIEYVHPLCQISTRYGLPGDLRVLVMRATLRRSTATHGHPCNPSRCHQAKMREHGNMHRDINDCYRTTWRHVAVSAADEANSCNLQLWRKYPPAWRVTTTTDCAAQQDDSQSPLVPRAKQQSQYQEHC